MWIRYIVIGLVAISCLWVAGATSWVFITAAFSLAGGYLLRWGKEGPERLAGLWLAWSGAAVVVIVTLLFIEDTL